MAEHTLAHYTEQLNQCVRCGACQAHCPVYKQTHKEGAVARGKIVLAAAYYEGRVDLEQALQENMSLCLLCGSCVVKCPNQVPTDKIVASVRQRITQKQGLSLLGRAVSTLIGSPVLLRRLFKGAARFSPILFKRIPRTSGLHLRLAPGSLKQRFLPPLPPTNLKERLTETTLSSSTKPTIGFFAGCGLTYLYPQAGEAIAAILAELGYPLLFPAGQGCCGMPALSSGNAQLAARLAETNRAAFASSELETLVTGCASCQSMLTRQYQDMHSFKVPVTDIHVFLSQAGLTAKLQQLPRPETSIRVTYHDPCHLRLHGITQEPRQLLQALPGVEFVEMDNAASCCGLGGTFAAAHAELSQNIGTEKIQAIKHAQAEVLVTGCPGCLLQLQDVVHRAGLQIRVLHSIEFIREIMQQSAKNQ